jgi:hypothetical protein
MTCNAPHKVLSLFIYIQAQDKHHFISTWYANHPLNVYQSSSYSLSHIFFDMRRYQQRDRMKEAAMAGKGNTLIVVPCWWDGKKERYYVVCCSPCSFSSSFIE